MVAGMEEIGKIHRCSLDAGGKSWGQDEGEEEKRLGEQETLLRKAEGQEALEQVLAEKRLA